MGEIHTAFQSENLRERLDAVCDDSTHIKNHLDELGWDSIEWINVAQDTAAENSCEYV